MASDGTATSIGQPHFGTSQLSSIRCRSSEYYSSSPPLIRPELPKKPNHVGNKTRPPVPRKPPTAHKPTLSDPDHVQTDCPTSPASPSHPSSAVPFTLSSSSSLIENDDPRHKTSTLVHGEGKSAVPTLSPPPLPKVPPRGTPQILSRSTAAVQSVQSTQNKLPRSLSKSTAAVQSVCYTPPRRPAPPLPSKKPVGVVPPSSSHITSPNDKPCQLISNQSIDSLNRRQSYDQVVVEDVTSNVVHLHQDDNIENEVPSSGQQGISCPGKAVFLSSSSPDQSFDKETGDFSPKHDSIVEDAGVSSSLEQENLKDGECKSTSLTSLTNSSVIVPKRFRQEQSNHLNSSQNSQTAGSDRSSLSPVRQQSPQLGYKSDSTSKCSVSDSDSDRPPSGPPTARNVDCAGSNNTSPSKITPPLRPRPKQRVSLLRLNQEQCQNITPNSPSETINDVSSVVPETKLPHVPDLDSNLILPSASDSEKPTIAESLDWDEVPAHNHPNSDLENQDSNPGVQGHLNVQSPVLQDIEDSPLKSCAGKEDIQWKQPVTLQDVGDTCDMLKEIEVLLNKRLVECDHLFESDTDVKLISKTLDNCSGDHRDIQNNQSPDTSPIRPPRPKHALRVQQLSLDSNMNSVDSGSTESLTTNTSKRLCPPKPKRKNLPGLITRSNSDVTGMKNYVQNFNEDEDKPFLPPRYQSLRLNDPPPPPLPPRNKMNGRQVSMGILQGPSTQAEMGSSLVVSSSSGRMDKSSEVQSEAAVSGVVVQPIRTLSGGKSKKPIPRPVRKAPPPPPRVLVQSSISSAQKSVSSQSSQSEPIEQNPGYRKIATSSVNMNDIGTVVPKTVENVDRPCSALGEHIDYDYHEIQEHVVRDILLSPASSEPSSSTDRAVKEETPPPDLPPRGYVINTSGSSPESQPDALKESQPAADVKEPSFEGSAPSSQGSSQTTSLLDVRDSVPDGFSIERPLSAASSQSECGSVIAELPRFDQPSSASESECEDDEERQIQKRERKVFFIAEEVVKSEQVFVDVLKLLNVDFRLHISKKIEQAGHPIIPSETLNKILDYLPQLHSFNDLLLKDLTERITNWEKCRKISDIFVKKGPFLKLYSSYIRNFEHATSLLDETIKKHPSFGAAVHQFEAGPRCASLALKHYMLKPIQRIPQYKLLLQDYLKNLTPESPDYKDTVTALNIVSEVADHANESMRHGDNVQKLLEIQRSLIGQFEVIQPGRILVKKGELQKLSRKELQPRMFFLFNDVLLYTTPTTSGYRLNNILPLNGMKVQPPNPKLEEFKNEFSIISTQRSLIVAAGTSEEREEWLRALWSAIDENSERYHTFRAMQMEPKTSLLDKDFKLGYKAPLWVPDARVTMCMLCLGEFSIYWRRHHCRSCGRIICGNCSENKAPLRYLTYKPARVCDDCYQSLKNEVNEQYKQGEVADVDESDAPTPEAHSSEASGLSFSSIKARFQKIRRSAKDKRKSSRPSVLKEVHANDEGSAMSGYLWVAKNKKWKRLWFVVKGKVLYTYKASEDMAAIESMPLLGFEITRMTSWYQGAEPDLMFELKHENTQPIVIKRRNSISGSEAVSPSTSSSSSAADSPYVKSSSDKTTPRLIFRTDSAAATTKWVTILRDASLA